MSGPLDDPLYRDPDLAQFYDLANGWSADFDYCVALAKHAESVLDIGCGTGELATALAQGRSVAGVDPAAAMLDIARQRPGGSDVTWVEADARSVRLDRRFDLVVLTGHAYQVFLTDEDQKAVLATIAAHLTPGGRFIFDTRNPALMTWKTWTRPRSTHRLENPRLGPIEAWTEHIYDVETKILSYRNGYRPLAGGDTYSASARIRYTPKEDLAVMIDAAGLAVDEWFGDWHGNPYHPEARDIIPLGGLALGAKGR